MRTFVLVLALVVGFFVPAAAQDATPEITRENVAAFFDAAFSIERRDHEIAGAVVSVVKDGELLFKRGYGWADIEERVPADPDSSLFRIASVSKTFVWTSLMQLVEQGRVDLDAPVSEYIDFEIPDTFEEPIRVWHLLTHTPGFEESWIGWGVREPEDVGSLGEELARLLPGRVWEPGKYAAYSNYGSALGAYIVERVSGQPWDDYIREHVVDPLGMTSTHVWMELPPHLEARHATGYRFSRGTFRSTDYEFLRLGPAGNMSSTAGDMANFMLMHLGEGALGDTRILEEETALQMQSPLFAPHPNLNVMRHGMYGTDRNGQTIFGHGGDVNQFHSVMSLFPEHDLGIFVSYNSDPGAAARSHVAVAFTDHFFPSEYLRPAPEAADVDLEEYGGTYRGLRGAFTTVQAFGQALSATRTVSAREENLLVSGAVFVPVGPDEFIGQYTDSRLVFQRDENGEISHMISNGPLGSARRVTLTEHPDFLISLLVVWGAVSALTLLGYGYRRFRPVAEEVRFPKWHVRLAWTYALLGAAGVIAASAASGSAFHGIGFPHRMAYLGASLAALLGVTTLGPVILQWGERVGTRGARIRYAFIPLAALIQLWLVWRFNIFTGWM